MLGGVARCGVGVWGTFCAVTPIRIFNEQQICFWPSRYFLHVAREEKDYLPSGSLYLVFPLELSSSFRSKRRKAAVLQVRASHRGIAARVAPMARCPRAPCFAAASISQALAPNAPGGSGRLFAAAGAARFPFSIVRTSCHGSVLEPSVDPRCCFQG